MYRLIAASLLTICLIAAGPRPAGAAEVQDAAGMVAGLNALRTSRGLPALDVHPELQRKAEAWASELARLGTPTHSVMSHGITAGWRALGENVAIAGTVDQAWQTLVASASHLANLVDPRFTHVGIGVVAAGGRVHVAQEFMQLPAAAPAPAPAPALAPAATPAPTPAPVAPKPAVVAPKPAPVAPKPAPVAPKPAVSAPAKPGAPTPTAPVPPAVEVAPPAAAPAVTGPPAPPAPAVTPVTRLVVAEPEATGASRTAGTGLAVGLLVLVAVALVARPRRRRA